MKTNDLFIGYTGYVNKDNKYNKEFDCDGISIFYKHEHLNHTYIDIFTNIEYKDFSELYCFADERVIVKPRGMNLFINKYTSEYPELEKFSNKNKLKKKELIELLNILNSTVYEQFKKNNTNQNNDNSNNINIDNSDNKDDSLFTYSNILTQKEFKHEPVIGRDKEIEDIIIKLAKSKGNAILVGPSGVGKTAIVDELAYKIKTHDVPDFLKNKQIIELDIASILSGTKYTGVLESKFIKLINYAVKNNCLLFIDEIHTIYGAGTHSRSDYDIAAMLKSAIERQGLKVIGTTTIEEYNKYFSYDALKRRFIKILVNEPTNEVLYHIIKKTFNDYSKIYNIQIFDNINNIIYSLIELTNEKHRTWDDKEYNPSLVCNIIDDIFAHARVKNKKTLDIEDIVYGINSCSRIYNSIKNDVINNLDIKKEETPKTKILQFKK